MDYTIKHVTAERELDAALAFEKKVFGVSSEHLSPAYSREKWLERMVNHGDLMLYAEAGGEIAGIVFGRIESDSITAGPVAVDERFRNCGVAREMMLLLEERAKNYGVHLITLGSVQSAEGFYAKCGYTGSLLIQSEKHGVDELLSLNTAYEVRYTNVYGGTINQVCLALPEADRELQRRYETALPGCRTQMMFWKDISPL